MATSKREPHLLAKVACIASVLLVVGVLWHISEQKSIAGERVSGAAGSLDSGINLPAGSSRKLADKSCQHRVSIAPPVLDPRHSGAVADIKRMTTDYAHISDFVQSCHFRSPQLSRSTSKTRGIVIPSAGHTMFAHTWVVVTILRETLGCTLPIEVIYNGNEELDEQLALRLQVS